MTASGENHPPASPSKRPTIFQQMLALDDDLAMICSVGSGPDASLASLRPLLIALEISGHGIPWLVGVFVVMYYTNAVDAKSFEIAFNILFALVLDLIVSGSIKAVVKRPRPAANSSSDMFFVVSVDHYSFPSGHTTRAVMLSVLAVATLPLSAPSWYLPVAWMVCIAASRVMLGRHHVSDVLAGSLIGYLQALFVQHYWFEVHGVGDFLQLVQPWKIVDT